ncbi:hypothetical protein PspS35_13630 [Pseudomonas sp. S35]|nr:hypothetical protein PspS35_13630 [Pseudomonas sp. S35]
MGRHITAVGASLLAKVVNDNAGNLTPRNPLGFFASKLAPANGPQRARDAGGATTSPPITTASSSR